MPESSRSKENHIGFLPLQSYGLAGRADLPFLLPPRAADVCEVVLHLHPLGILFKPLASFFATFLIVPLARVFGYWEAPIPAYVMLVGAAGTYLCLYEKKRAPAPHQHVELATVDDATPEEDARARKAPRPLGAGAVVGTATVEDDFPVSEHFHENTGQGWVLGGAKEKAGYVAVDAEEVEKHVLQQDGDEAARLLGGAGKGDGAGRSLVGFLLLGAIFGVLVTSMAVWVIVQKLVNDRCRVNEFGFTALDQVGTLSGRYAKATTVVKSIAFHCCLCFNVI